MSGTAHQWPKRITAVLHWGWWFPLRIEGLDVVCSAEPVSKHESTPGGVRSERDGIDPVAMLCLRLKRTSAARQTQPPSSAVSGAEYGIINTCNFHALSVLCILSCAGVFLLQ